MPATARPGNRADSRAISRSATPGAPPKKKCRVPGLERTRQTREHQVRTVDPLDMTVAGEMRQPYERHAVRRHQSGSGMDPPQLFVALALHHAVDAGDADVMRRALTDPRVDGVERLRHVDGADRQPEHVETLDGARPVRYQTASAYSS